MTVATRLTRRTRQTRRARPSMASAIWRSRFSTPQERAKMPYLQKPDRKVKGTVDTGKTVDINIYKIDTQRGPKKFMAANETQAARIAKSYGLEVRGINKVGQQKLTFQQAYSALGSAAARGKAAEAEAHITFGAAFEKEGEREYKAPPKDSIPIRMEEGFAYIDKETAEQLRQTDAYTETKGSDTEKLSKAYSVSQESFEQQLKKNFPDLYTIYKEKGTEAYDKAFKQWQQDFVSNLKIQSPELYEAYKAGGWGALGETIEEQNKAYAEFQAKIASGEIIALPDNTYITKEVFDEQPSGSQQILMEGGFAALETAKEVIYEKKGDPSETFPRYITREQYGNLNVIDRALYSPAPGYGPRIAIELGTLFAPPLKAALPEYTLAEDVSATDWALAAANVALIGIAFAPGAVTAAAATAGRGVHIAKGVGIAASSTISGVVTYETIKRWDELTNVQRGIGVGIAALCAIPILTTVARNVKIGASPTIPTVKGNVVTWKGLSVAGYPIIGKSGGKWVLGTRSLTIPEARLILDGYHPQMMLETKVFVNRAALTKAGFAKTQIDYLEKTLKARKLFAGKTSPWLDKDVLIEPTQRLNSNEINIVMRHIAERPGQVKNAKFLYGSPTIKAQAAPELRSWRAIHDWDISVTGSQSNAEAFTKSLLKDLQARGSGVYRINPKIPTLIEKQIKGAWTHIADIHPYDISSANIPVSKLDATGAYSYGRMVSEPAITVSYPGYGKIHIMRISESGVRKADTILRVRQTPTGTAFRPPARGIAQPGVPKDAADLYVILRTFKGEKIAEDWLKSWARAMGYTDTQMAKVLPKIRTAMLEVAAQTPSDIIGYEFIPAKSAAVAVGASPSIIVRIPSSLGASVSPSLAKIISQPVYPYSQAQSPSVQAQASLASQSIASQLRKLQPASMPPSTSLSPQTSPYTLPSRSLYSSISPSPSPSPSPSLSPYPSPLPSPGIGLTPVAYPSPSPTPSPYPYPYPGPHPCPSRYFFFGEDAPKREVDTGRIVVRAKMDGRDWEGPVKYTIESQQGKLQGSRVSATYKELEPATYTLKYQSGKPAGTVDYTITPNRTRALKPAGTISYTIEFSSKPIYVEAKQKVPKLTVMLPTVKGAGGVLTTNPKEVLTIAGVKQVAPLSSKETVTTGVKKLTLRDYGGIEKHGTASTYVAFPKEPLVKEKLSLSEFMAEKPGKISEALWRKFGQASEGVVTLGEKQDELLPFGIKGVRPAERRIAVSSSVYTSATPKLSKQAYRRLFGYDRYYLGRKLPEPELKGKL